MPRRPPAVPEEAVSQQGTVPDMLDLYWAPKPAPFSVRGLVGGLLAAAGFLAVGIAALFTIDVPARAPAFDIALLLVVYVLATQVRFEFGPSFVLPTELTLVPLLFLAPLGAVPLLVAAAMTLGTAVWVVRGRLPPDRLVSAVADSWHVIGPVGVFALAGAPEPSLADWHVYAAAFGAQILIEGLVLSIREWVNRGIPLLRHVIELGEGQVVDALLFCGGLLAAAAATSSGQAAWALLTAPFIGLLALLDQGRRKRIRISQERLEALEEARTRGESALVRVGEAMGARLDADALVDLGVRSALEAVGADAAIVQTPSALLAAVGDPIGPMADSVGRRALAQNATESGEEAERRALAIPVAGLPEPAVVVCARSGPPFSPEERHRLLTLVSQLGAALQGAANHERVRRQAETDYLTGLANHRRFQEILAAAVDGHALVGASPGLLLVDLDHFKRINDTHGHQMGDLFLQAVGRLLGGSCRPGDEAARYGGEELAVVISDTTPAQAMAFAQRVCDDIARLRLTTPRGAQVSVTASVGVAVLSEGLGTATALIAAADSALYRAKQAGRNRVMFATDRAGLATVPALETGTVDARPGSGEISDDDRSVRSLPPGAGLDHWPPADARPVESDAHAG